MLYPMLLLWNNILQTRENQINDFKGPIEFDMKRMPSVVKWLRRSQNQVLDKFQGLPDAFSDGDGQKRFVFVPGTRKDRVLLVAHADTVWYGQKIELGYSVSDGIIFSKNRIQSFDYTNKFNCKSKKFGIGIGADDRAGCAIAWSLRNSGHSILITSGEEIGCVATQWLMQNKYWSGELNSHNFAVQFDRHGKNDIVFYDNGTNEFVQYVKRETGYKPQSGSWTDIRHICRDICGVNISVGYYDEHRPEEKLIMDQYLNTMGIVHNWLNKPNLNRFALTDSDKFTDVDLAIENRIERKEAKVSQNLQTQIQQNNKTYTKNIVCPKCKNEMEPRCWWENYFKCTLCKKEI